MKKNILFLAMVAGLFYGCDKEKVEKEIILEKANLSFEKLEINGKTISTKQIFAQIKEKEKAGFQMKSLVVDNSEIAEVQGEKPNFSILIKKAGTFKITLILEKAGFEDVKIVGEITIIKKIATFEKLKITNGAKIISKNQILEQIKGLTNLDYQIKSIEIPSEKSDFAEVKNDFSIEIKKVGNFTAKIILEKSGKLGEIRNVEIENCAFEISNPIFTFEKLTKNDGNKIITKNEILAQIQGLTNLDYTIKNITVNNSEFAEVKNHFSIKIKKIGSFTATIILEKTGFLDVEIENCAFSFIFDMAFGGSNLFDNASAIIKTSDGNLVVAGTTNSKGAGNKDAWVFKLNEKEGEIIWEKTYGGNEEDGALAIIETTDGNLAVAGYTKSKGAGNKDGWVLKINKDNGNTIWEKTYGGNQNDDFKGIVEMEDGNLAVVGGKTAQTEDLWLLKLNKNNGNTIWEKTYGDNGADDGSAIIKTSDGNLVVVGDTNSKGSGKLDGWILKLNKTNGNILWEKTYGRAEYDIFFAVTETTDENVAVVGNTIVSANRRSAWLLKLNKNNGNTIWEKTYGSTKQQNLFNDSFYAIIKTADGNLAVAGRTKKPGFFNYDAWILKLNNAGNKIWEKSFGGKRIDDAVSIVETSDGNLAVGGSTSIENGYRNEAWIFKIYGNDGAMVGSR